ncbi:coenzyme F420-0:L-glutamate ligase [Candidatus Kaiserbacteria bacterium]|nr:coenzyme F420-0:L-glutamate ligase [Candidatus Kaiserbacteria bacterium]USN92661.1 MAG: coenzyme F420-0:L-glutamate ligase [Candidatus Nomurabacteria bacterium]
MQYIPVKTRILKPPKDDLFSVLDEYLPVIKERDVVVISSKVVAIGEGRCVKESDFNKKEHIEKEAEVIIPRPYWKAPLTITNHVMVSSSGVDRSNSNGYYTLLPADPFASAEKICAYLKNRFKIRDLGIIITDSVSSPCRFGATGRAIGFWGFVPLKNHIGEKDLFGRKIKYERANLVDGIASGANVLMGEVAECTPIVIARGLDNLEFKDGNFKNILFCSFAEDTFRILYERFL